MRIIAVEEAFSFPGVTPPFRPGSSGVTDQVFQDWSRRLADIADLRLADMDAHGRPTTTWRRSLPIIPAGSPGSPPSRCRIRISRWPSCAGQWRSWG